MRAALAFGTYVGCSLLLFGRSVLTSPAETVVGDAGADKTLYMWSLVWWPSSLVRGRGPFETCRRA